MFWPNFSKVLEHVIGFSQTEKYLITQKKQESLECKGYLYNFGFQVGMGTNNSQSHTKGVYSGSNASVNTRQVTLRLL